MLTKQTFLLSKFTTIWHTTLTLSNFNPFINAWKSFDCKLWNLIRDCAECGRKLYPVTFNFSNSAFSLYRIGFLKLQIHVSWKTKLTVWQTPSWPDSLTNPTLRLEPLSRNQNGSRHDQGPGMRAEVRNNEYSIAFGWGEGHWYCFSGTT